MDEQRRYGEEWVKLWPIFAAPPQSLGFMLVGITLGVLIGVLVYLIRRFGGYPDAFAFAVLLANLCVPLIDSLTRPKVYGDRRK